MNSYRFGRYEFFIVIILIALVLSVGIKRYLSLADSAQALRFQILANHFAQGAANARANWIIAAHSSARQVARPMFTMPVGAVEFFFSPQGWPLTTDSVAAMENTFSLNDCHLLWKGLLQNPPELKLLSEVAGAGEYRFSIEDDQCRYWWFIAGNASGYFDYKPQEGTVNIVIYGEE